MTNKWPCHRRSREQWCDRDGPGGFMGHTCVRLRPYRPVGLPKSNLHALQISGLGELKLMATCLRADADRLEREAKPSDTRTRSIVRQMRRVAKFYIDVVQQR